MHENKVRRPLILNKEIVKPFYYKNAFTPEECKKIINSPEEKSIDYGSTHALKISNSKHIAKLEETKWIWERLYKYVTTVNSFYKFKLAYLDHVHTMEYGTGGYFKWHIDMNGGDFFAMRKITVVAFLSERKDYEGGKLIFDMSDENETEVIDMEIGSIILFPSFMAHKVTEIKSGVRTTLVAWVYGDSFS